MKNTKRALAVLRFFIWFLKAARGSSSVKLCGCLLERSCCFVSKDNCNFSLWVKILSAAASERLSFVSSLC